MNSVVVKKYFRLKENGKYYCLIPSCPKNFQTISTSHTNKVGNLKRHLKSSHIDLYNSLTSEEEKMSCALKNLKLIQYYTELVTVNGRPFQILEGSGIVGLIAMQQDELTAAARKLTINADTIQENIKNVAIEIREKIADELKDRILCVMTDITTKNHRGILGLNVQYYFEGKIILRTLGMLEMNERHTSETIVKMVRENLDSYGISLDQVYAFTSDNAPSMLKGAELLDLAAKIAIQHDNFAGFDFESFMTADDDADEAFPTTVDESLREMFRNAAILLQPVTGIGCAAHSLQIAIHDGMTASNTKSFISKCREIVKNLRTQIYMLEFKKRGEKRPLLDNATRWNSKYLLV